MILSSLVIGRGPVIIIIHGLFGEGVNWLSIGKELSANFEVHLIDQRNHGKSFHNSEHNYFVLADDLYRYIKAKKINTFSLIGHSMGGKVAIQFTLTYSNLVDKLMVVDILPKKYQDKHNHIFNGLREVIKQSKYRTEASCILERYVNDIVTTNFLLKGLYFSSDNEPKLKFNLNFLEQNIDNMLSFPEIKSSCNNEIHFISGSRSNYIQKSDIKYMNTLFPSAQFIEIEDAGHWVHFDKKKQFLDIVNKILKL